MSADPKLNTQGLSKNDYVGAKSTLCAGCGHDSVTSNIINALFLSNINPYKVAKMSGIGCSSKSTTYLLNNSFGFNALHGRMGPVSTGAKLTQKNLLTFGVSGDGDTASIGLGGFIHLLRRNVPMVYIVENNGVYGLTKGQFSATADKGTLSKSGQKNPFETIDICSLALDVGCSFVARSFSGDRKQLTALLMAAFRHPGTALIDVISPCITFANHEGSTRSYDYVKNNLSPLHQVGFVESRSELVADYNDGEVKEIEWPDGSILTLKKIDKDHDVTQRTEALTQLVNSRERGQILTGLFYTNPQAENLIDTLNLPHTPLCEISDDQLRPSLEVLNQIQKSFK